MRLDQVDQRGFAMRRGMNPIGCRQGRQGNPWGGGRRHVRGEATMLKARSLLGVAAALMAMPLASPAWSAACVTGSVTSYVALDGTGCSVDGVTFSNISVSTLVSGGGTVTLGNFTPFSAIVNGVLESGLSLNYDANAGLTGSSADISWTYNVSRN